MTRSSAYLALIAYIASLITASPVLQTSESFVTLSISKKVNSSVTAKDLVIKEKARIGSFKAASIGKAPSINEDVSYIAVTKVGAQNFDLIVDTGSSNTWVGAGTPYVKSSSGASTGNRVSVSYGSGSFSGIEYTDKVTLGGLTVSKQSVGVATSATGFDGVDGILGVGPVILTQGTVSGVNSVPTFLDNLKSQGSISSKVLGVYFHPESGSNTADSNGELAIGGVNTAKYKGTLTYVPKRTTGDFAYYWGITVSSVSYGSTKIATTNGAIVDTGTTLVYIPSAGYQKFLAVAGGKTDYGSGLAVFSKKPTSVVTFVIGGRGFNLTPTQYLIPTAQYSVFGLSTGKYYAWINDGGSSGVNFIIGQKFLENYYSVFDSTNSRIGLATRA